ncbi:LysE family translocator [Bacillus sp. KH172YL63]|uniref:LysE family translocator n=1 Tax=Bacillus sp. KH172YL63 TaxID=2709784 RepID=UPI0013E46797|nr:LysE family transporter [Bacillus sp. KH172YL63]BCB04159.1 amino acid transporter LysE [Bacillus sp. KH172YL63]
MNAASFLFYCVIVTFTPGPTNIIILSTVQRYGTRKAMEYTYGATIAFGLLLALSALLNSLLMTVIPKLLIVMQVIGSLYMIYLAYQVCKKDAGKKSVELPATFRSGFYMQFLNPKVVLFTMTVIPSFILPHYVAFPEVTAGVLVITVIGFAAFLTWVLFGTIFKAFLRRHTKTVNVLMALFLCYSAVMIWM